jgi:predicted transcriptional regulator
LVQAFLKKWWVESDFKAPNIFCASTLKLQWKESSNSNDHQCHQHQQREQSTTILMELIEHKNKSPLHMTRLTYFPPINLLFYKPLYKNMLSLSLRHQYFITFELTLGNSCIIVSIAKIFVACILIGILEPTIKMRAWIYRKEWVIEWLSFNAISAIV